MLRLAVKRDSRIAQRDARTKRSVSEAAISTEKAYLICDSRSKGFPIRHVSKGFEAFFGCNAAECVGSSCSHIVSGRGFEHSAAAALNKVAGAGIDVETSIDRMSSAAEKAVQSAAKGGSMPVILISVVKHTGDLCVCELSMCKQNHPTLGWSYHAALLKDVSGAVSVTKLFKSAQTEQAYEELCSEWRQASRGALGDPAPLSGDLSDELNAVAEQLWKDELAKGIKPKASNKSADADTSSIWSRSTASTLASRTPKEQTAQTAKAFHFGALLSQNLEQADAECDDGARKRFAPATETECDRTQSVRRRETLESSAKEDSDGFLTASEDEKDAWEECDPEPVAERKSGSSSSSLLMEDVVNPVEHVDRPVLRRMNYLKHVELDDCPFLLALHAYLPSEAEQDSSREKLFARLNARLDEVIAEMASEYVYYAPMRRQTKYHPL